MLSQWLEFFLLLVTFYQVNLSESVSIVIVLIVHSTRFSKTCRYKQWHVAWQWPSYFMLNVLIAQKLIFIYFKEASSPSTKRRSNSTSKHINAQGKTWNLTPLRNKAHDWWKWHQLPLNNFPGWGGQNGVHSPKMSILTVVWTRSLSNAKRI